MEHKKDLNLDDLTEDQNNELLNHYQNLFEESGLMKILNETFATVIINQDRIEFLILMDVINTLAKHTILKLDNAPDDVDQWISSKVGQC